MLMLKLIIISINIVLSLLLVLQLLLQLMVLLSLLFPCQRLVLVLELHVLQLLVILLMLLVLELLVLEMLLVLLVTGPFILGLLVPGPLLVELDTVLTIKTLSYLWTVDQAVGAHCVERADRPSVCEQASLREQQQLLAKVQIWVQNHH